MRTKDRIVEVAIWLFNEKGTKAVTTNHIAAAVGISPGNLYYHFRNKEDIIRAAFLMMVDFMEAESSWGSGGFVLPSLSNLDALFQKLFAVHWEYRFFFRELGALTNRDRELKTAFSQLQTKRLREIENSIRAFMDAGILKPIDEATVDFLKKSFWVFGNFWHSFVEAGGEEITVAGVEEGIEMLRNLLRPYLSKSTLRGYLKGMDTSDIREEEDRL